MLVETTFGVGGVLCVALGIALGAAYLAIGLTELDAASLAAPGLFVVMGAIFLWVARDARRSRLELLALGEPPGGAGGDRESR